MKFEPIQEYPHPDNLSLKDFNKNHLLTHKPCIIRNCLNNLSIDNWTLNYINQKCGDNLVNVRYGTNSEEYRNGTTYSLKQIKLCKYIENLKKNSLESQKTYLAVQNIKHTLRQLHDESELPEYIQNLHSGPFLWIARPGHYEYMHVDPDEGFLMIISGQKSFKLFSYENFHELKPHKLGSPGRTIQSGVDMSELNYKTDPEISEKILPGKTCIYGTLNSSDALYIPAFYWHQVTSDEMTVSLNSFWGQGPKYEVQLDGEQAGAENNKVDTDLELDPDDVNSTPFADEILKSSPTYKPGLKQAFIYWFQNILEQNKVVDSNSTKWLRQLSRLDEVLHCFLATQWKQKLSKEVVEEVTEIAKEYYGLESLPERLDSDVSKYPPLFSIKGLKLRPRPKVAGCKY